jgi:hypothetical protein
LERAQSVVVFEFLELEAYHREHLGKLDFDGGDLLGCGKGDESIVEIAEKLVFAEYFYGLLYKQDVGLPLYAGVGGPEGKDLGYGFFSLNFRVLVINHKRQESR